MKKMKCMIAAVLAMLLICSFAACHRGTQDTASKKDDWVWISKKSGAFGPQGYFYLNSRSMLKFLDTSSGVTVTLCNKAGCLHEAEPDAWERENCEAMVYRSSAFAPLFYWNEGIYYIQKDEYGFQLYRRNADGTGLSRITTLATQYIEAGKTLDITEYALADGFLYYKACVMGADRDETGIIVMRQELNYIGRLDIQAKKETVIAEESEKDLMLYAVKKDAALFTCREIPDTPYEDPGYQESILQAPISLLCWSAETQENSVLLRRTKREFSGVSMVMDGKAYYTVHTGSVTPTYSYDLSTGYEELVSEQDGMRFLGGGYARCIDEETKEWYVYNTKMKKRLPVDIEETILLVREISDRGVILWYHIKDDNGKAKQAHCYVPFKSLSDGLQMDDLMIFETVNMNTVTG